MWLEAKVQKKRQENKKLYEFSGRLFRFSTIRDWFDPNYSLFSN